MAKALLLDRPSGTFARFLVPHDLRAQLGRRYVIRRLPPTDRDGSRLIGACMGYALGKAFLKLRKDPVSDPKKLIDDVLKGAQQGELREYIIQGPGGFSLQVDGAEDHARAMEALPVILKHLPGSLAADPPVLKPMANAKTVPMLHASIALFLEQFAEKNPAAATLLETRHSVELFRDLTRDKPMGDVGVEECDAFRAALALWPARARVLPEYKGMTPRAILAKAKKLKSPGLNVRTKEKHLDRLRVFFNWAVQRRWMATNPLTGVRLQSKAQKYAPKRRGFTRDELARLFAPALRREHCLRDPSKFWLPVLALYTGARLRELAQLRVIDVRPVANVWGIDITPEAGPLKNAASQRFVPLPDTVLEMGLLDYVETLKERGFERLFPDGSWEAKNGPGDKTSKWWARTYMPAAGLDDEALVFHSFRHALASMADELGMTEAQIGAITGHKGTSVLRTHYINAGELPERKARLDAIARAFGTSTEPSYTATQIDWGRWLRAEARRKAVVGRSARQKRR